MSSLLAKRLSSFFPSLSHHHHSPLLAPLTLLSFSTETAVEQKEIPFLTKYLISTFGFSPDRALKISTYRKVAAIKSEEQATSVVKFLKETGLSDDQIEAVISFHPPLLCHNVEQSLKPKLCELVDAGFSQELLVLLIRRNPSALLLKDTLSRLLFWRDFVGNGDQGLLNIIQNNGLIITYHIDKHVVPRIKFFKEYGFSDRDLVEMLARGYSCCMSRSLDSFKHILEFIEEMGIPRASRMFLLSFKAIRAYRKDTITHKVEFFKITYGWSQEEVKSAFKKFPGVLAISVDKLKSNMNFLIRMAKLEPRSIASHPIVLGYSLQKRLVPRQHVLSILVAKGMKENVNLPSAYMSTEKRFFKRYIEPYKKDVPELAEAYFAASSGNIPV